MTAGMTSWWRSAASAEAFALLAGPGAWPRRRRTGSITHPPRAGAPVRQWVLPLPIPLRLLLAAQPKLLTPVLQVVHRVITRHLLGQAGLKADEADSGAVTLIQPSLWMKGSAANLNIHLHCLVLDGVYRCSASSVGADASTKTGSPSAPHRYTPSSIRQ